MKITYAALAILMTVGFALPADAKQRDVQVVRKATERFKDVDVAKRAGYRPAPDCVAEAAGGMGIHYTNARLVEDPRIQLRRPEVLLYEPHGDKRKLVAVEYFRAD